MKAAQNTALLVWGLLDDVCCSAKPLTADPQSNSHAIPLDGWNTPASLLQCAAASPVRQVSLGWMHALLLTDQGGAYVALASQLLQKARAPLDSSALQLPPVSSNISGNSSSIWQPVQLLNTNMRQAVSGAIFIQQIAAGDQHCLLLDKCGCVWAMGSNQHGQLGLKPTQQPAAAAEVATAAQSAASRGEDAGVGCQQEQQISGFAAVLGPGSDSDVQEPVKEVAAGACHRIAVTASLGRLYAWGWNAHGQCGTGSTADVQQPTLCAALDGVPLACAAAGMAHTVAASRDGAVYAWGCGSDGQLGLTAEPTAVDHHDSIVHDSAAHSQIVGTGAGGGGGGCKQQPRSSLLPMLVEDAALDQEDVVQVACGSRHTVVLTATGRAFAWGLNKHGQCCTGAGDGVDRSTAAAALTNVSALSQDTFEVQTITAPRPVELPETTLGPCLTHGGSFAGLERSSMAAESMMTGPGSARKLVKCGKAVAVRTGRWHTILEVAITEQWH